MACGTKVPWPQGWDSPASPEKGVLLRRFLPGLILPLHPPHSPCFSQQMAVPVPWACCAVLAAATAIVYAQRHSPQGECWGAGVAAPANPSQR